jgi:hypothetical protein
MTRADNDGEFCLDVLDAGGTSRVAIVATRFLRPLSREISLDFFDNVASTGATCADAVDDCVDVGTVTLVPDNLQCAYGTAEYEASFVAAPLTPFTLYEYVGDDTYLFRGRRRPDDEAQYCLNTTGSGGSMQIRWLGEGLSCDFGEYTTDFALPPSEGDPQLCDDDDGVAGCTELADIYYYCHS